MSTSLADVSRALAAQVAGFGAPSAVRRFEVAGVAIEYRVYGDEMAAAVLPAFDGLRAPSDRADAVVIHAWDHAATGTELPAAVVALRRPGLNPRYVDSGYSLLVADFTTTLVSTSGGATTALFTCDATAVLPSFHRGAPTSLVLAAILSHVGRPFLHAACVGLPGLGGLLLTGKSGSGKSTTSLRCLAAGWQFVGDDYVVLHPGERAAHRLYSTAKLDPRQIERDPGLIPRGARLVADPSGIDKMVAFVWPTLAVQLGHKLGLTAIAACRVAPQSDTTWQRVPAGKALLALAPSTLLQLPVGVEAPLAPLAQLSRQVPCYEILLGSDPDGVTPALAALLSHAAGGS